MTMIHETPSDLAGKLVRIKSEVTHPQVQEFGGALFRVEDWWDRLNDGQSWRASDGNAACIIYAWRAGMAKLIPDDEVLYGHVGMFGHLVHISEIEAESAEEVHDGP